MILSISLEVLKIHSVTASYVKSLILVALVNSRWKEENETQWRSKLLVLETM
jgi:hypothetical protein